MKIAYLDCFSGISGNMILGACVDLGVDPAALENLFAPLEMEGFRIHSENALRKRVAGTHLRVEVVEGHGHRKLGDVVAVLDRLDLSSQVRRLSEDSFRRIAEAEGRVHGKPAEEIHFHEVGALDAIVDTVGSVWCLEQLGVEKIVASPVHTGTGFVHCMHGDIPLPAPATAYILEGIETYSRGIPNELVTPTGAALLRSVADEFGPQPSMKIEKVGYGLGDRDLKEIPNCLRIVLGKASGRIVQDSVVELAANIDDMNPEIFGPVMERCFEEGALDVALIPAQMKKNRPGTILLVLAPPDRETALTDLLLRETTTLGVRSVPMARRVLERREVQAATPFGPVRIKVAFGEGVRKAAPEYEDCHKLAKEFGVPIQAVYQAALLAFGREEA